MQVVFASAEVAPFAKTGGLGDVCGALPRFLARAGHDVTLFLPFYREVATYFERQGAFPEVVADDITISWSNWSYDLTLLRANLPGSGVPIYFFANSYFFNRESIYSARWDGTDDNLERYVFFCRAVIRCTELLGLRPDILHAHDWHTAPLPVYLHSGLRGSQSFRHTASVYTIHNLNYQGRYPASRFRFLGLHDRYWQPDAMEYFGDVHFMKSGIVFADQVTTVSPNYASEIQTEEFGAGLDGLLRENSHKLTGILNGIDTAEWDPSSDFHLPVRYDRDSLSRKAACKEALCGEIGLPFNSRRPLIGVISRLVEQKGIDLLIPIVDAVIDRGAQIMVLGSGEQHLEDALRSLSSRHRNAFKASLTFDPALAHRITAGCDLFVMPSRYEPCGLNQMYALRYGTLPLVRMTGGLADTVVPYEPWNTHQATGFGFKTLHPLALLGAIDWALQTFQEPETWRVLQRNGMAADFAWESSARMYEQVYARAIGNL